jgi:hypothetical protein
MGEPLLRHRQTKEAETDMFSLPPPRHISTLPLAEMPAAARHGRLLGVKLPAARPPFVNPDSAYHGPRRKAGGASIIPPMQQLPLPGDHHRGVELGGEIGGGRYASSPANRRGASSASRSMLTTCRCAGGNAGGAIGREALDWRHGGEWRRIKPGEPGMPARGAAPASRSQRRWST